MRGAKAEYGDAEIWTNQLNLTVPPVTLSGFLVRVVCENNVASDWQVAFESVTRMGGSRLCYALS